MKKIISLMALTFVVFTASDVMASKNVQEEKKQQEQYNKRIREYLIFDDISSIGNIPKQNIEKYLDSVESPIEVLVDAKLNNVIVEVPERLAATWIPCYPKSKQIDYTKPLDGGLCKCARKRHPYRNAFFTMKPVIAFMFWVGGALALCSVPLAAACWYFKFNPITDIPQLTSAVRNWDKAQPGLQQGILESLYFGYKGLAPYGTQARNFGYAAKDIALDKRTMGASTLVGLGMTYFLRKPLWQTVRIFRDCIDAQICDMPQF